MRRPARIVAFCGLAILGFRAPARAEPNESANPATLPTANARSRELGLIVLLDTTSLGVSDTPALGPHVGVQLGHWFSIESGLDVSVPIRGSTHADYGVPVLAWAHLGPDEHTIDFGLGPEFGRGDTIFRTTLAYRYAARPSGFVVRAGVDLLWATYRLFGSTYVVAGSTTELSAGWRF